MTEHLDLRTDRPHPARVYDYLLGGSTNYAADRAAAEEGLRRNPNSLVPPRENRAFLGRAVRYLAAEQGIRQFLDIGTGVPTRPTVHEVAQEVAPDARVVYTDNDPIVLAHARALLAGTDVGRTAYLDADLRDPDRILADPALRDTLDLTRPVALLLIAVLHFVGDADRPHDLVRRLLDALPAGSFLALSHLTGDFDPTAWAGVTEVYARQGVTMQVRSKAEISHFFDGLELEPPGLDVVSRWRRDGPSAEEPVTDAAVSVYGGVARKP